MLGIAKPVQQTSSPGMHARLGKDPCMRHATAPAHPDEVLVNDPFVKQRGGQLLSAPCQKLIKVHFGVVHHLVQGGWCEPKSVQRGWCGMQALQPWPPPTHRTSCILQSLTLSEGRNATMQDFALSLELLRVGGLARARWGCEGWSWEGGAGREREGHGDWTSRPTAPGRTGARAGVDLNILSAIRQFYIHANGHEPV